MQKEILTFDFENNVGRIILDRPDKGNALNSDLVRLIGSAFDTLLGEGARLILIQANGKNFCTGFDLSDLETHSDGDLLLRFVAIEHLLQKIYRSPVMTVAIGRGRTFGAGADLFAACNHRVALSGSSYNFPGAAFGLILGVNRLANRVGGDKARSLILNGAAITDKEACRIGLATSDATEAEIGRIVDDLLIDATRLEPQTVAAIHAATIADTDDADLANLVRSASRPGLNNRIKIYRERMRSAGPQPVPSPHD